MLASIDAGDWTAIAAVGTFLIVIGGLLGRWLGPRLAVRRERRRSQKRTVKAVWGLPEKGTPGTPDFYPKEPGLIDVTSELVTHTKELGTQVAELASQIKQQGIDYKALDARVHSLEEWKAV